MKQTIGSILAAVDRDDRSRQVVAKAVALARMSGARLELFHCDAERAYSRMHQYDPRAAVRAKEHSLAESRRFLESLWHSLAVSDMEPSMSVGCESPLYEAIVHAVERDQPDLVVRGIGGARMPEADGTPGMQSGSLGSLGTGLSEEVHTTGPAGPDGLDPNDWLLVSTCPSPLLLTRGKPWKPHPVVAAAIDLSAGEPAQLTQTILRTAGAIARTAGGELVTVHAGRFGDAQSRETELRRNALVEHAKSAGVDVAAIHIVAGEPMIALPEFAAREDFDLIVLGALTHRKTLTALVGTLTGKLIETLDCDFLLVKPPRASSSDGR
ncbi:MAG TPA: universal stress protein [Steroidobacteraceae bacterium]|nr:universal stress protein [Steroidobacteraceae bacterium]